MGRGPCQGRCHSLALGTIFVSGGDSHPSGSRSVRATQARAARASYPQPCVPTRGQQAASARPLWSSCSTLSPPSPSPPAPCILDRWTARKRGKKKSGEEGNISCGEQQMNIRKPIESEPIFHTEHRQTSLHAGIPTAPRPGIAREQQWRGVGARDQGSDCPARETFQPLRPLLPLCSLLPSNCGELRGGSLRGSY